MFRFAVFLLLATTIPQVVHGGRTSTSEPRRTFSQQTTTTTAHVTTSITSSPPLLIMTENECMSLCSNISNYYSVFTAQLYNGICENATELVAECDSVSNRNITILVGMPNVVNHVCDIAKLFNIQEITCDLAEDVTRLMSDGNTQTEPEFSSCVRHCQRGLDLSNRISSDRRTHPSQNREKRDAQDSSSSFGCRACRIGYDAVKTTYCPSFSPELNKQCAIQEQMPNTSLLHSVICTANGIAGK